MPSRLTQFTWTILREQLIDKKHFRGSLASGVMNPGEELKMVTAKSPLVLSILRVRPVSFISIKSAKDFTRPVQVMAYEFMWTPNCTSQGAKEGVIWIGGPVCMRKKHDPCIGTDRYCTVLDGFLSFVDCTF